MKYLYKITVRSDGTRGPVRVAFPKETLLERLREKTVVQAGPLDTPCFIWTGSRNKRGYGALMHQTKTIRTNRASWIIHRGRIPPGMEVCHRCDNPACWNPDHLFVDTHEGNMRDAAIKGRVPGFKGEAHSQSKLTEDQVRQIRREYRKGNAPALARKFGVNRNSITMIAARTTWKHI